MKIKLLLILFNLLPLLSFSCTTFVLKDSSQLVFGRNLDWVSDDGLVVVNKRNIKKTALVFPPDQPVSWTSKYGSITFNQFGKEFPFGGINEKGLVVEIMLVEGDYPRPDHRKVVNELQWIQYQLDNAATVDEVIQSDKNIRISKVDQNLHFLICDKSGKTAVIEFSKSGMTAYTGKDLPVPVLENDTYAQSLKKRRLSTRFWTASDLINAYQTSSEPVIDYAFDILDKVKLEGSWSIVYDIKNMRIHFKTASHKQNRIININSFNFNCNQPSLIYNLKSKQTGEVNSFFVPFSKQLNQSKFDSAVKSNNIRLPGAILNRFRNYNSLCTCTKHP